MNNANAIIKPNIDKRQKANLNMRFSQKYKPVNYRGFTIVELLVVIVVIGILAAITIVSYSGITTRANIAAIEADLSSNSKILKMYSAEYGVYPSSLDENNCPVLPVAVTKYCLKIGTGSTFTYSGSGINYSLSIAKNGLAYYTTSNKATSVVTPPTLTNNTAASITASSAIIGGTVFGNGGANVTNYGVCYGLTANPTNCVDIEQGALTAMSPATVAATNAGKKVIITADGMNAYTATNNGKLEMFRRNTANSQLIALTPSTIASGDFAGRDIISSPDGKFIYAISTNVSSAVKIYMYNRDTTTGLLNALTPGFIDVWSGGVTTKMIISPDGKFVYVYHDSKIYIYSRDSSTGLLALAGSVFAASPHGEFAISPDGLHLYTLSVDGSNNGQVLLYNRDPATGLITYSALSFIGNSINPSNIAITPDGKFVYVSCPSIRQYSRNPSNGQLTILSPATATSGSTTSGLEISIDGKTLYTSETGQIGMYSINKSNGQLSAMGTQYVAASGVREITVTPDNNGLYSANSTNSIGMYNRSSGASEGDVFTKSITGLTTGTTYYYRTFSTNSAGTSYSADSTFTTL